MKYSFINQLDTEVYLHQQRENLEKRVAIYTSMRERIADDLSRYQVPLLFDELLYQKLDSDQKYCLSTELLETKSISHPCLDVEIYNRIRIWRKRWHWQRAHADIIGQNGPHDYALTIRFQRNYTPSHCVHLAKAFCTDLYYSADKLGYTLSIAGSREPDSLPVTKDMSFHLHASLSLRDNTGLPANIETVTDCVSGSVSSTKDYADRRAIVLAETKLRPIFYERGWHLYSTKLAQRLKGEFTPNVFLQQGNHIEFL